LYGERVKSRGGMGVERDTGRGREERRVEGKRRDFKQKIEQKFISEDKLVICSFFFSSPDSG
jgi:hypothetical protein